MVKCCGFIFDNEVVMYNVVNNADKEYDSIREQQKVLYNKILKQLKEKYNDCDNCYPEARHKAIAEQDGLMLLIEQILKNIL